LQLLDDGRLTDGQGRTVDFRNTLVVMTSNLGSELWLGGEGGSVSRDAITQVLQAHFRPEFLNRIDEIIIFHSLSRADLVKVVDIQLRHVSKLLAERGYQLAISPQARAYLAEVGYDADYGARPLKRAIQRELQDPLAVKILGGEFHEGETIRVERGNEKLEFIGQAPDQPVTSQHQVSR
jgi:ATP-dependent Clp protease ATP-binding subunit ClpB